MMGLGQSTQPYNGGSFGGDPFGDPWTGGGGFPGSGGITFPFGTITNPLDVGGVLDALQGLGIDVQDVANWIGLGRRAIDLWNDIVEGGGGGLRWSGRYCEGRDPVNDPCPGTPDFDAIWRAVSKMPQEDVDWLLHGLGQSEGPTPASRIDLLDKPNLPTWVCGVMGGQDCAHTTSGARDAWPEPYFPPDRHFVELVAEYGAPGIFGGGGGSGAGGMIGAAIPWLIGGGLLLAMLRR